jgi:hypothetical protein
MLTSSLSNWAILNRPAVFAPVSIEAHEQNAMIDQVRGRQEDALAKAA